MISGFGSLIIGDVDFTNITVELCTQQFVISEQFTTYGYDYIDTSSQLIKPAGSSIRRNRQQWFVELDLTTMGYDTYAYLNSLGGPAVGDYPPVSVSYVLGSESVGKNPTATAKAYNITQCRPQSIIDGGSTVTFPPGVETDTIFVIVEDLVETEPQDLAIFTPNDVYSFTGYMVDSNGQIIYLVNVPKMMRTNLPNLSLRASSPLVFEILYESGSQPYQIFKVER